MQSKVLLVDIKPYRNAPNGPKPISHLPKATIAEYINGQANNKIAIIGLIAAYCYNKFSDVELPTALSFFSGKRLVPIMEYINGQANNKIAIKNVQ
jgi:phosphotransferase system  glucose/maltose/N-acetylglucosamine-specific IIC component